MKSSIAQAPPGENGPVDVNVVLNAVLQAIKRLGGRSLCDRGEHALRAVGFLPGVLLESLAGCFPHGQGHRFDGVQLVVLAATLPRTVGCVPVENLQHGEGRWASGSSRAIS